MILYIVKKFAQIGKKELILDIGSSCGHSLITLVKNSYVNLVALYINDDNFENFNKYGIKIYIYDANIDKIPLDNNSVSVVLTIHIIEHLLFPDNLIREAFRV